MSIADEKYVAFTTFKKDGTPRSTPVWIVALDDGRLGFTTSDATWKVTRLRNDARVRLQPSDSKGKVKPGSRELAGTALVETGEQFEKIDVLIASKYGIMNRMIDLVKSVTRLVKREKSVDVAVVITLDEAG